MKFCLVSILLPAFAAIAADTNALPALAPAYGEMPPTFLEQHGTLVIIGVFAFFILVILILWKKLQPKSAVILPPAVVARAALAQLQRQPENGKVLSEVSQILRRYFIAAFELQAGELTTAEFSAALAGNEKIGAELVGSISGFLQECDERKFSPANSASLLNAANRALELIERVEKHLLLVGRASPRAELGVDGSSVASPHQKSAK